MNAQSNSKIILAAFKNLRDKVINILKEDGAIVVHDTETNSYLKCNTNGEWAQYRQFTNRKTNENYWIAFSNNVWNLKMEVLTITECERLPLE